jgi:ribonuclease D
MTPEQIRRHARGVLLAVEAGLLAPAQRPRQTDRESDEVRERYDRLHTWRKNRARARGVESDVILPRTTLLDLARQSPRTLDDLVDIVDFGPWRRDTYGEEILALVSSVASPPRRT